MMLKIMGLRVKVGIIPRSFLIDYHLKQRDLFVIKFGVYPEILQECVLGLFQNLLIFMYDMSYLEKVFL